MKNNNPVFSNPRYDSRPICPVNEPRRSGFNRHMFVSLNGTAFDSCAGPVTGQWTCIEYLEHVLDTNTVNTLFQTGSNTNTTAFLGIREITE